MTIILIDNDCSELPGSKAFADLCGVRETAAVGLDGDILEANGYDLRALLPEASRGAAIDRVFLLSRMSGGVKRRHTRLVEANRQMWWFLSILDVPYQAYRGQITNEFDRLLLGQDAGYVILFDTAEQLSSSIAAMAEPLPEKPECVIVSKAGAYAERLAALLRRRYPDWAFFCSGGEHGHKYARRLILAGSQPEDFALPPIPYGAGKAALWVESPLGVDTGKSWKKLGAALAAQLEGAGWELPDIKRQTWFGILDFEELKTQLDEGEITPKLLRNSEPFVPWDEFGLPLTGPALEDDEAMHRFLERHCCLDGLFNGGRAK